MGAGLVYGAVECLDGCCVYRLWSDVVARFDLRRPKALKTLWLYAVAEAECRRAGGDVHVMQQWVEAAATLRWSRIEDDWRRAIRLSCPVTPGFAGSRVAVAECESNRNPIHRNTVCGREVNAKPAIKIKPAVTRHGVGHAESSLTSDAPRARRDVSHRSLSLSYHI